MADTKSLFNELSSVNVNDKKETKNGLSYLSWAWAWAEVKSRCPDATYEVKCNADGLPYFKEDGVGYMCMTEVTIKGETLMMWLPVMDYRNKAILQPTMFDINKTIMRCLTKNLGMFGLGLYIYAGEDLPQDGDLEIAALKDTPIDAQKASVCKAMIADTKSDTKAIIKYVNDKYKVNRKSIDEFVDEEWYDVTQILGKKAEEAGKDK